MSEMPMNPVNQSAAPEQEVSRLPERPWRDEWTMWAKNPWRWTNYEDEPLDQGCLEDRLMELAPSGRLPVKLRKPMRGEQVLTGLGLSLLQRLWMVRLEDEHPQAPTMVDGQEWDALPHAEQVEQMKRLMALFEEVELYAADQEIPLFRALTEPEVLSPLQETNPRLLPEVGAI